MLDEIGDGADTDLAYSAMKSWRSSCPEARTVRTPNRSRPVRVCRANTRGRHVGRGVDTADERAHCPTGTRPACAATFGQTLAVTGAAGAFGGYVVQLATAEGLRVIADASPADEALVRSLGEGCGLPAATAWPTRSVNSCRKA